MDDDLATTLGILKDLAAGLSSRDAAERNHVSRATMNRRLMRLRADWHQDNNVQLIITAVRRGLI
ncbi:hypothetical protein [Aeromicrobium sp. IC_218]|uniref:hypothetical protein n=1 Tax=Aeromicrobium sp. IC_218 TaxID=2545468 RepID=UPI00103F0DA0|nr:hypothetical protein [Aeromicrobium sp. IC_218]TCI96353.1 hypothetical protein E0W78_14555 [Aeromicrobium sp. IC_218]